MYLQWHLLHELHLSNHSPWLWVTFLPLPSLSPVQLQLLWTKSSKMWLLKWLGSTFICKCLFWFATSYYILCIVMHCIWKLWNCLTFPFAFFKLLAMNHFRWNQCRLFSFPGEKFWILIMHGTLVEVSVSCKIVARCQFSVFVLQVQRAHNQQLNVNLLHLYIHNNFHSQVDSGHCVPLRWKLLLNHLK